MKYFIITIDTEGDNLWAHKMNQPITTENSRFLPRFQNLCNKYNFMPVYLTNYEMAKDEYFINFVLKEIKNNNCEIGLHIHAWNNPPLYELISSGETSGLPYLIEYPKNIMSEKIITMLDLLKETFGNEIISHRSGRWAMNQDYFDLLIENNIKVDCSVTPHVSWLSKAGFSAESMGSDYSSYRENPYFVKHSSVSNTVLEVPVTIRMLHRFTPCSMMNPRAFFGNIKAFFTGKPIWLRPNGNNLKDMLALVDEIKNGEENYLMFMLHSSELMPGGSPTFKNAESIEILYNDLNILFDNISKSFKGITLKDYYIDYLKHQ